MPVFIRISKTDRIKLFNGIKTKLNISFNRLYPKFEISRAMFFNYLSGKYDIPQNLFLELKKISHIKIISFKEIRKEKYIEKQVEEPPLDESLAEVFGILNGDGHISQINHEICVVISHLEEEYLSYIKKLFENTLKLNFRVYRQDTRLKLRANSKNMVYILHNQYNIPKGNKMGKLKIPAQLLNSQKFLISYLRGLFDTDGSFYIRREKDPVISISSADPHYLKQVQEVLIALGFNARLSKTNIMIYDKDHINKFFKIIKPANTKHLKKYQNYLNLTARG